MKKFKNMLAVLLALVMCISMVAPALAADDIEPSPETETETETETVVPKHDHNKDGWVCTVEYVNDGDCILAKHSHSANCEEGAELICGLREHQHTDDCYTEVEAEDGEEPVRTLTCAFSFQAESHEHTDACYTCAIPVHTHGSDCQYLQKAVWTCTAPEEKDPEVKEKGKLPVSTPGSEVTDTDNIYVYIEPGSINDAGFGTEANYSKYLTLAKIDFNTALSKYNEANPDNQITGTNTSLEPAEFNALVQYALLNGYAKDKDNKDLTLTDEQKETIKEVTWVYVKGSSGATDFLENAGTVHADGHVHQLKEVKTEATCTTGGTTTYQCVRQIGGENCGYEKEVYTAPLGHSFPETWTDDKDGAHHSHVCGRCGEKITAAHNWTESAQWGDWEEAEDYATSHEYVRTRELECKDCHATKSETETKKEGQVILTVKYQDENGNELQASSSAPYWPGTEYNVSAPEIPGYTAPDGVNGTISAKDDVIILTYTPIDYTLTVIHQYIALNGNVDEVTETVDAVYHIGDSYSTSPSGRNGYQLTNIPANAEGVFGAGHVRVTYVYNAVAPVVEDPPVYTPPVEEVVIDEPDVPLTDEPDLPEEELEIDEPDIPLSELPELPDEELEIDEPDVPLSDVPQTGDISLLWYAAASASACGLLGLQVTKKREDGEA